VQPLFSRGPRSPYRLPHGMVVLHRQSDGCRQPSLWLPADLLPPPAGADRRQGSSGRYRRPPGEPTRSTWPMPPSPISTAAATCRPKQWPARFSPWPGQSRSGTVLEGPCRRLAGHHHREQPPPVGRCRWICPGLEPDPGQARGAAWHRRLQPKGPVAGTGQLLLLFHTPGGPRQPVH
jgi:hypothetical protein